MIARMEGKTADIRFAVVAFRSRDELMTFVTKLRMLTW